MLGGTLPTWGVAPGYSGKKAFGQKLALLPFAQCKPIEPANDPRPTVSHFRRNIRRGIHLRALRSSVVNLRRPDLVLKQPAGCAIVSSQGNRRNMTKVKEDVMELWQLGLYAVASVLALRSLTTLMANHRGRARRDAAIQARLRIMHGVTQQAAPPAGGKQQATAKTA